MTHTVQLTGDDVLDMIRDIYRARQLARSISEQNASYVWRRPQFNSSQTTACPFPAVQVAGV
jgi:hypothetical protein